MGFRFYGLVFPIMNSKLMSVEFFCALFVEGYLTIHVLFEGQSSD